MERKFLERGMKKSKQKIKQILEHSMRKGCNSFNSWINKKKILLHKTISFTE